MRILTTQQIAETLHQPKFATTEFAANQLADFIENQPFLFEYAARPELGLEMGVDEKGWLPPEGEDTEDEPNSAMLSVVASLIAVTSEHVEAMPYVLPADLMEMEQALGPKLVSLMQSQEFTDEEFFDVLVEQCRQRDLLSFALDLLNMHHEDIITRGTPEQLEEWSTNFLHDAVKMRIIVDTLDHVTEPKNSN